MPDTLELTLAGEQVHALADRALYWPARRRLFIADLHLGKGDILRAAGIAVPSGGTRNDLSRIDRLLRRTAARELWILGDFLHGARQSGIEKAWRDMLAAHPALAVGVVAGNHDRALRADALHVELLPADVRDGPFRFRHHPLDRAVASDGHVLCGHVHPVVGLPGLPGRFPAFLLEPGQIVLPAFSAFTGGCRVGDPDRQWIACAKGELVAHLR